MKPWLLLLLLVSSAALADSETRPIAPLYNHQSGSTSGALVSSVTVAATTTHAASGQFPGTGGQFLQVQIANLTTSWAYVQFGVYGNVTAATVATGYPVAPGSVVVVTVNNEVSGADVILDSSGGTGNVIFTVGQGI
jgi:hypothetical protein